MQGSNSRPGSDNVPNSLPPRDSEQRDPPQYPRWDPSHPYPALPPIPTRFTMPVGASGILPQPNRSDQQFWQDGRYGEGPRAQPSWGPYSDGGVGRHSMGAIGRFEEGGEWERREAGPSGASYPSLGRGSGDSTSGSERTSYFDHQTSQHLRPSAEFFAGPGRTSPALPSSFPRPHSPRESHRFSPVPTSPPHLPHPRLHSLHSFQPDGVPESKNDERPFQCEECPLAFHRNHDLKRHKKIHLDVKPYPCHGCDKRFTRKDALKRHLLVKQHDTPPPQTPTVFQDEAPAERSARRAAALADREAHSASTQPQPPPPTSTASTTNERPSPHPLVSRPYNSYSSSGSGSGSTSASSHAYSYQSHSSTSTTTTQSSSAYSSDGQRFGDTPGTATPYTTDLGEKLERQRLAGDP